MRSVLSRHLGTLAGLWSATAAVAASNALAVIAVLARAEADVFALYVVGQTLLALTAAWTDGGLAQGMQVLAAERQPRSRFERYRAAAMRCSLRLVPLGLAAAACAAVPLILWNNLLVRAPNGGVVAGFIVAGLVNARTSLFSALLYAAGRFGTHNVVLVLPAVARLGVIAAAGLALRRFDLETLLGIELMAALGGYALARVAVRRVRREAPSPADSPQDTAAAEAEVRGFVRPTAFATAAASLTYHLNVLVSSSFVASASIAAYGLFQRLGQILVAVASPAHQYMSRELRLTETAERRARRETLCVAGSVAAYMVIAAAALAAYSALGARVDHYGLGHPVECAIYLGVGGLGQAYLVLDAVLAARGIARHRVLAVLLACVLRLGLIAAVRPTTLLLMVCIDAVSVVPAVLYCAVVFVRRRKAVPRVIR